MPDKSSTSENPEIQAFARTATRLHPAPGSPTADESHIGGPLRWPDDEPWPYCANPSSAGSDAAGTAFVPVAQFFRRDFPMLPIPDGQDLLQLLWCPNGNEYDPNHLEHFVPLVRLVWRDSASLSGPDFQPPAPVIAEQEWLPTHACVLRPCQVAEYPQYYDAEERGLPVGDDWPRLTDGSKIGGWTPWYQTGPETFFCADCDRELTLMLSLHTFEQADGTCSCAIDETGVGWELGREGALNIYVCPQDVRHPVQVTVD